MPQKKHYKPTYLLLSPGLLVLFIALFLPMLVLFGISFQTYVPGSGKPLNVFTLENYTRILDPLYLKVFGRTFAISILATLIALIMGYPAALLMARCKRSLKGILLAVVLTPLLTNVVARNLGLIIIFGSHGPVNNLLGLLGIPPVKFVPGQLGIILSFAQVFLPYMILSINSVLENIDFNLQNAARNLGCSRFQAFRKVIFPLSTPGIVAGSLFVFLLSFSSLVTPQLLGGGMVQVMSMLIQQQAMSLLNWPFAAALAFVLMVISLALVTAYNHLTSRIERMVDRGGVYRDFKTERRGRQFIRDGLYRINRVLSGIFAPLFSRISPGISGALGRGGEIFGTVLYYAFTFLVFLFIILPLPVVIISSFGMSSMVSFPPEELSLKWYRGLWEKREYITSMLLSLRISGFCVLVSLIIGTCTALGLSRNRFRFPAMMKTLFLSPLMVPAVIIGIAIMRFVNIVGWRNPFWTIFAAHLLITVTYVTRTVLATLVGYNMTIEYAARDLGAGPFYTFRKITLPLIKPSLIVSGIFAFIVSLDETTITIFLTGGRTTTLPVRIFSVLEHGLDSTVTVVSSILIVVALTVLLIINKLIGLDKFKI
jgi:putative spermidine/putrescine transport system permease protein